MPQSVLVTGIGILSPAGCGADATWSSLLAGCRAVGRFEPGADQPSAHRPWPAARVPGFTPRDPAAPGSVDRVCRFALAAAQEALNNAGKPSLAGPRTRVSIGTSKGGVLSFAAWADAWAAGDRRIPNPWADLLPDAPARYVAQQLGITGGAHTTVAACATGSLAVIRAAQWIADGQADLVVCGSSDACLHPLWFAAFERMGVLAEEHVTRGAGYSCRPFDDARTGFALGEGAAALILESEPHARKRDAQPLATLAGWATGTDPAGLTAMDPAGESLRHVLALACDRAGVGPEDIACIHAHGTGTRENDRIEGRVIRDFLNATAPRVPVVSIKGAMGHLLGAAGSVELAVAARACQARRSPGNATLLHPDPEFAGLCLPRESTDLRPGAIVKLSLGFGGHVAAVVLEPVR